MNDAHILRNKPRGQLSIVVHQLKRNRGALIGLAVIIPLIVWFDHRFPIRAGTWRVSVLAHALFSVVASVIHVIVMYIGRILVFRVLSQDNTYRWVHWASEFGYEYLKDFRTYMLILAMVYLYRYTGDPKYLRFCEYLVDLFESPTGPQLISSPMSRENP